MVFFFSWGRCKCTFVWTTRDIISQSFVIDCHFLQQQLGLLHIAGLQPKREHGHPQPAASRGHAGQQKESSCLHSGYPKGWWALQSLGGRRHVRVKLEAHARYTLFVFPWSSSCFCCLWNHHKIDTVLLRVFCLFSNVPFVLLVRYLRVLYLDSQFIDSCLCAFVLVSFCYLNITNHSFKWNQQKLIIGHASFQDGRSTQLTLENTVLRILS